MTGPGVNHIAVVTDDLEGYRAFYENVFEIETALVLGAGPGHGRQAIAFAGEVMLHVFEVERDAMPAHDAPMFRRGRLDHLGFTVDDPRALAALRRRLLEAGASAGEIRPLGWLLSLRYVDSDGFEGEVNCLNPHFDPSRLRPHDEVIDPQWHERVTRALGADHETTQPRQGGLT